MFLLFQRLIDKSCVTCIKWIPGSPSSNLFLVSFSSGCLYVFNHELPCSPTPPVYQLFKQGEGFAIYTCKAKSTRNPLYKWQVGHGAVNQCRHGTDVLAQISQCLCGVGEDAGVVVRHL